MVDTSIDYARIFDRVLSDPRYKQGITYGKPRQGHQEGTVANHIDQLDSNLERLRGVLSSDEQYWKLRLLIYTHDTFKLWAKRDSPIEDPQSHGSLAQAFLAEFLDNNDPIARDLLHIVKYHDEPYALWKQVESKGKYNQERFRRNVVDGVADIELFLLFTLIDGYTPSKKPKRIRWYVEEVSRDPKVAAYPQLLKNVYAALTIFGI